MLEPSVFLGMCSSSETFTLTATIDMDNVVVEMDESNNMATIFGLGMDGINSICSNTGKFTN